MEDVSFIKPLHGIYVNSAPWDKTFPENKSELAVELRRAMNDSNVVITDATRMAEIMQSLIGSDDTAWPRRSVRLRDYPEIFEVEMGPEFSRVLDDGTFKPAETIVMPLHATTILFCAEHDRARFTYYCTSIVTCEDARLLAGDPERPFFVWIIH